MTYKFISLRLGELPYIEIPIDSNPQILMPNNEYIYCKESKFYEKNHSTVMVPINSYCASFQELEKLLRSQIDKDMHYIIIHYDLELVLNGIYCLCIGIIRDEKHFNSINYEDRLTNTPIGDVRMIFNQILEGN